MTTPDLPLAFVDPTSTLGRLADSVSQSVADYAPSIGSALFVFLALWLVAKLVRGLVKRLLQVTPLDEVVSQTRLGRMLQAFREDATPSWAVANLAYVAILLMAVTSAAEALGIEAAKTAVLAALGYLPKVISALLIVAIGSVAASAIARLVGAFFAEFRGGRTKMFEAPIELGIMLVVALIALESLGVDVSFITSNLSVFVVVLLVLAAFLMAWSMRRPAEEIIANYYLRQLVRVGDDVKLEQTRGVVERFVPLGVMLRDAAGKEHFVPARHVLSGLERSKP
ncbi:MAG: mechanosensitive ion channel family protein [Nannocystaceae bacterium]|nr:hypothetical protein [bacterium]